MRRASPVRDRRAALVLLVVAAALVARNSPRALAQQDDGSPAAAQPPKVLEIQGKVLDIVGVTRGIDATLKDLGAKVTTQEIRIELPADVLFDFDRDTLRPDAVESLREVAAVIAAHPGRPVLIEGHTDAKGDDAYNQKLSERRAAAVRIWLVSDAGVDAKRIATKGLGESKPRAPNAKPDGSDDPEGRQANRRVEIVVQR